MGWALAAALSAVEHASLAAFDASKPLRQPPQDGLQNLCCWPMHLNMEPCSPMDNVRPNAGVDGFSDWELLFRLEVLARSMRGLFDHRPIVPAGDRCSGPLVARMHPMAEVMERLLLLGCTGDPNPVATTQARHALRRALLSSELGRGLLLPPDLQDKLERDICLALAQATDPIADGAVASAAMKLLMDPCTLRHLAALVESGEGSEVPPASTVQVFLQTLAVGQS